MKRAIILLDFEFLFRPQFQNFPQLPLESSTLDASSSTSLSMEAVTAPKPLPSAVIRPFNSETDLKVTRFLVGSAVMEPAAQANKSALFTPMMLLLWALFTNVLVERYVGGWPDSVYNLVSGRGFEDWVLGNWTTGLLQWMKLGPVLVAPPIVLLAMFELRHRNKFEDEMTRAIGDEDMREISRYYQTENNKATGAGRTGFWVLEFDGRIIGTFGLDGQKPGVCLDSTVDHEIITKKDESIPAEITTAVVEKDERYALRNRSSKSTTVVATPTVPAIQSTYTDTLHLRRFATSLSFRPTGIEDDFLEFAAKFAFSATPSSPPPAAKIVISVRPSVQKPFVATLLKAGYRPAYNVAGVDAVDMDGWRSRSLPSGRKYGPTVDRILNPIWPLDLNWVTYVLKKEDWLAKK